MAEVAAVVEVQAHNGVAGVYQRKVSRYIGLVPGNAARTLACSGAEQLLARSMASFSAIFHVFASRRNSGGRDSLPRILLVSTEPRGGASSTAFEVVHSPKL